MRNNQPRKQDIERMKIPKYLAAGGIGYLLSGGSGMIGMIILYFIIRQIF